MIRTRNFGIVLVALVLLSLPSTSLADDVTWNLSGVTFSDGATASGFFVYNADTNTVISADIVTTMTSVFSGATYTAADPNFGFQANTDIVFVPNPNLSDFTGTPALNLFFGTIGLTDAGGTVALMTGSNNSMETTCGDIFCTFGNFPAPRFVTAGVVTTQVASTPEPSAILLLVIGLLVLLGGGKRLLAQV